MFEIKGDHFKNYNMTLESYNNQLIRHTNIYSKLLADLIWNSEKETTLLTVMPKEYSLIQLWKGIVDYEALLDKLAGNILRSISENKNKLQVLK